MTYKTSSIFCIYWTCILALHYFILQYLRKKCPVLREPKVRLIMAQSITDKIVNHLVSKYFLVDVFEPLLIDNNIATRIGKGTHIGIKKVKECLRKNINKDLYILKFDIKIGMQLIY